MIRRERVIQLEAELVAPQRNRDLDFVPVPRKVRQRDPVVHDPDRHRIEPACRDPVAWERIARVGIGQYDQLAIVECLREVSLALESARHVSTCFVGRRRLVDIVIAGEEERSVAEERSTKAAAPIVAFEQFAAERGRADRPPLRVQAVLADEIEQRSRECVGARLGDDVHHGAAEPPVLGRVAVGLHAELPDGVGVGDDVAGLPQTAHVGAAVKAVIDCAGAGIGRPVDQCLLSGDAERVDLLRDVDPFCQVEQRVHVAVDEREVEDLGLINCAAESHVRRVYERRVGDDLHVLHRAADMEYRIDAGSTAQFDLEAGLDEPFEAAQLGFESIGARSA
jgi:hypothetical protein